MKIQIKKILSFGGKILGTVAFFGILWLLQSCNGDVDFGEQYKKTIYMVHGENLLYSKEHNFDTANDKLVFSIYCASSENSTQSISVQLQLDRHALDSLNIQGLLENDLYVDKMMLPASNYEFPANAQVTIPAGQQYATFEVPFHPAGLDCDASYALPVSIVSNDRNYEIIPEMRSLVYEVRMINKYSGYFTGTSALSPTTVRPVQPTLKAVSANQVRLPIHDLNAENEYLDTHFMLLTMTQDGRVTITPWRNAKIADLGDNFFDEVQQSYTLHYRYTDDDGGVFTVTEKLTNIDASKLVQ